MGERLMMYFKYITDQAGVNGKVELAQMSKLTSMRAATAEDSPENLKLVKDCVTKITGKPAPNY